MKAGFIPLLGALSLAGSGHQIASVTPADLKMPYATRAPQTTKATAKGARHKPGPGRRSKAHNWAGGGW